MSGISGKSTVSLDGSKTTTSVSVPAGPGKADVSVSQGPKGTTVEVGVGVNVGAKGLGASAGPTASVTVGPDGKVSGVTAGVQAGATVGPGKASAQVTIGVDENNVSISGKVSVSSPLGVSSGKVGISMSISDYIEAFNEAALNGMPIVLDLTDQGLRFTSTTDGAAADLSGHGIRALTAWIMPDEGFLLRDTRHVGMFSAADIVLGHDGQSDLAALATTDLNGDGAITGADAVWSELAVWRDANSDGVVDQGEVGTMADLGITSLSLAATPTGNPDAEARVTALSTFTTADGRNHLLGDVTLHQDGSRAETSALADIGADHAVLHAGYGTNTIDASGLLVTATLIGGAGNQNLIGSAGDDVLDAGTASGTKVLAGGAGSDRLLSGGTNFTYAGYGGATSGVTANLADGAGTRGDAAGDTYTGINGLIGSPYDDVLTGGWQTGDVLNGEGGNDICVAISPGTVLDGGTGGNILIGSGGGDTFFVTPTADAPTWDVIRNAIGEIDVWGWQEGISTISWSDTGPAGDEEMVATVDLGGGGGTAGFVLSGQHAMPSQVIEGSGVLRILV